MKICLSLLMLLILTSCGAGPGAGGNVSSSAAATAAIPNGIWSASITLGSGRYYYLIARTTNHGVLLTLASTPNSNFEAIYGETSQSGAALSFSPYPDEVCQGKDSYFFSAGGNSTKIEAIQISGKNLVITLSGVDIALVPAPGGFQPLYWAQHEGCYLGSSGTIDNWSNVNPNTFSPSIYGN